MKSEIKKYLQKIGQKGGKAKNAQKRAATSLNLAKARDTKKAKRSNLANPTPIPTGGLLGLGNSGSKKA